MREKECLRSSNLDKLCITELIFFEQIYSYEQQKQDLIHMKNQKTRFKIDQCLMITEKVLIQTMISSKLFKMKMDLFSSSVLHIKILCQGYVLDITEDQKIIDKRDLRLTGKPNLRL